MSELLVMLRIGGRSAALPAVDVQSVIEVEEIHRVPRTPDYVVGLTAMRSRSLTVIDSRLAIGIDHSENTGERAVVIEVGGHMYAVLVDAVEDVAEARTEPCAVAGGFGDDWARVATGMVETSHGPTLVIDIEKLVAGPVAKAA